MKQELVDFIKKYNSEDFGLIIQDVESYVEKLTTNATIFTVYQNSLKGMIAFYCNDSLKENAFLSLILVDETVQNQKIGLKLLKNSIDFLKSKEFKNYHLEVLKTNTLAINFYKKNNFEIIGDNNDFFKMILAL